jgi:L-aspartate oxidase
MTSWEAGTDLLVVGSGVAGLTAALEASALGLRVLVVTKAAADDGNTRWAQGGVAVVDTTAGGTVDGADSVHRHVVDTVNAGAGLCDEAAVRAILADGPAAVAALRRRGAVFDRGRGGSLARTREGGHSAFRVIHAGGDATGAEIERALLAAGTGLMLEHHAALDVLLTDDGAAAGLLVLGPDGTPGTLRAPAVLLATGGLGQLYTATTNPAVATGDGLALALRAGATATDLEFVQFHPTVLYTGPGARGRRPLVTEAVRGEGAVLVDATGARVMAGVHPLADLAARDVVAAAITARMARTGDDHVFLDATGLPGFATRFPTVAAACREAGIDPSREPIPVAPAAHYSCGGVESTVDGRTSVTGLYAAGEVARTGLHGANRLASNSLLEGLVVGTRAAHAVAADLAARRLAPRSAKARPVGGARPAADRDTLQRAMSRFAGVGRDAGGLDTAAWLIERSAASSGASNGASNAASNAASAAEDAELTLTALAVLAAAAERTETRGCHVRTDHPARDDAGWRRSVSVALDGGGRPVARVALAIGGAA